MVEQRPRRNPLRRGAIAAWCLVGAGAIGAVVGAIAAASWAAEHELPVTLVVAVTGFAVGAVLLGAGLGLLLGRVRERLTRVALHPSLVAAADRKLERLLAEHAQDLVTMLDDHGRFTYVSPSASAILGRDPSTMLGKHFGEYLEAFTDQGGHDSPGSPAGADGSTSDWLDASSGSRPHARRSGEPIRHRAHHADGSVRWMETLSHRIEDDRAVGVVTIYSSRDVTERVRLEETLAAERRLLGDTLANIHAGIMSVDLEGRVIDANTEFCAMVGFRPMAGDLLADVEARYDMLDESGATVAIADRPLGRSLTGVVVKQVPATMVSADGATREVMANSGPLIGSDGRQNGAVLTLHDVSELRAAESELRSLATVDMLTGLPNRRHLVAALTDAMARNAETPERLALLFLDLDGFKRVNDTFGHDVGDQVLTAVGTRIVGCLRGGDIVARLGGDEFVVVVEHLTAPTDVLPLIGRIEKSIAEPFELPAGSVTIGASVGVASGSGAANAADLLSQADQAMYLQKRRRAAQRSGAVVDLAQRVDEASVSAPG